MVEAKGEQESFEFVWFATGIDSGLIEVTVSSVEIIL